MADMTPLVDVNSSNSDMDGKSVPVIDMSLDTAGPAILRAFQTIGFATLTNHGIGVTVIEQAFAASKSFFDLELAEKMQYKYQGPSSNRGYIPYQAESHTNQQPPDRKETFDIGSERTEQTKDGYQNRWPTTATTTSSSSSTATATSSSSSSSSSSFQSTMMEYFDKFDSLHLCIMKMLAIELSLSDDEFFVKRSNSQHENLRLLHYPAVPRTQTGMIADQNKDSEEECLVPRGNVHTDFGTITLLTQDGVGGLRVQTLDGKWITVPPLHGSIIVNVGDMLQRWTNDKLRATPHQVVEVSSSSPSLSSKTTPSVAGLKEKEDSDDKDDESMVPERYSIAFFCNANKDVLLECLPECLAKDTKPRYEPINAHEYLSMRLSATINA